MKNAYEIRGDITAIFVKWFGKHYECLVDTVDLPKVQAYPGRWYADTKGYVYASPCEDKKRIRVALHRLIMDAPKGMDVDHKDSKPFNNRRYNLEVGTHAENMQNLRTRRTSKSGVRGVHWDGRCRVWRAYVQTKGKRYNVGRFNTLVEAEEAVIAARARYFPFSTEARNISAEGEHI